jgi:hypothetical protein
MTTGNGSVAVQDLRAIRAALGQAQGKRKLDLILSAPDPRALVRALPPQELYLTILDVGMEDSAELVAMATPQQFVHFLDAGCWPKRDAPPDPRKLLKWLTLARQGAAMGDNGTRRFREKLAALDSELFSLLLRFELTVHELDENEDTPDTAPGSSWITPDRKYMVEIREDGAGYATLKRLLDDLTEQDPFMVSRTLEAIRWDVPTELEEVARRWRNGRLRDLGVPEFEEALGFVARPHRTKNQPPSDSARDDGSSALELTGNAPPLLERAVARLSGDDLDHAEQAVAYAANASLVAWGTALDDPFEVRRVLTDARSTLSLGLELLSGGDEALAARALAEKPVREIFQLAMGQLYRLQTRARAAAAAARLPETQTATVLEPPYALLIDALLATPPALDGVDDWAKQRVGKVQRSHAPATRREVAAADALLDEAETLGALLAGLGLSAAALRAAADEANLSASAVRASDALRAAALCDLRGAPFSMKDLPDRGAQHPEGFAARLDALLEKAVASVPAPQQDAARRLSAALRKRAGA